MYKGQTEKLISGEADLLDWLTRDKYLHQGNTVILAGHYMLLYDAKTHSLFPAVKEELKEEHLINKVVHKTDVGSFPIRSFKIGLEIIKRIQNSKIALLVNDEKFRSEAITKEEKEVIEKKGGDNLRQSFFWEDGIQPHIYQQLIDETGKSSEEVILLNNNLKRSMKKSSILPPEALYFSERVLNRRFNNSTVNLLLEENRLYCQNAGDRQEIRFKSSRTNPRSNYCVSSDHTSPCVATSLQFFYELIERHNMTNIIMMIPKHCKASVNQAAEISLNILKPNLGKIIVVSNLEHQSNNITYQEHLYEDR